MDNEKHPIKITTRFIITIAVLGILYKVLPPLSEINNIYIIGFKSEELVQLMILTITFIFTGQYAGNIREPINALTKFSKAGEVVRNSILLIVTVAVYYVFRDILWEIAYRLHVEEYMWIYTVIFVSISAIIVIRIATILCTGIIYLIAKKKPEKPKEEPIKKKLIKKKTEEKPILKETEFKEKIDMEISPKMKHLLERKEELNKELEELKKYKYKLISQKTMTEEEYNQHYEEIMDKLVDIEDKIIQEKMKGGVKK